MHAGIVWNIVMLKLPLPQLPSRNVLSCCCRIFGSELDCIFLDRLNQVDPLNAISVSYAWRSLHFKDIKRASLYCVR